MTDFAALLRLLGDHEIKFIVIGGVAAFFHGSARSTLDLDIVYSRDRVNLQRIIDALAPLKPYLRGAPPGLPFKWDFQTLRNGLNFTLVTTLGDLDLLGEVVGGGSYEQLVSQAEPVELFGSKCLCVNLEPLIRMKRAAGRNKDLQVVAELTAIAEERQRKNV